jgi:hypothetical protein
VDLASGQTGLLAGCAASGPGDALWAGMLHFLFDGHAQSQLFGMGNHE